MTLPDPVAARRFQDLCTLLGCPPAALAGVWYAESGWYPTAHNPNGHASGVFQAMPATLHNLGFHRDLPGPDRAAAFRELPLADQIPWAAKYYRPYAGRLPNTAACYLATFTPAFLDHASEPEWVIASKTVRGHIYAANSGFDRNGNYSIEVGELAAAVQRACRGARWAGVCAALSLPASQPAVEPAVRDRSVLSLQRRLGGLVLDGLYGPKTAAAVRAFQKAAGLKVDGIAGPKTWAALEAA